MKLIRDQVIFLKLIFCENVSEICFISSLIFQIIPSDFSLEPGMIVEVNIIIQSDYA